MIKKETTRGDTNPLFIRFINRTSTVGDVLRSIAKSQDPSTSETAKSFFENPPDLDEFRAELEDAVRDLITSGLSEEVISFLNHYMEDSILQVYSSSENRLGENRQSIAIIKDAQGTWVEGFICYNLSLYIKAFGLSSLKSCHTCSKIFSNKGQWAKYCSDPCNPKTRSHPREASPLQ